VGPHAWDAFPSTFDAMLVATHPDDELVPFRGLLPRLASQGKTVLIVLTADAGIATRREAARDSIWTTGLRHAPIFMGLADACFGADLSCTVEKWGGLDGLVGSLAGLIDQYRPATLYTHDAVAGENGNEQHRATALAAVLATLEASHPPEAVIVHRWARLPFAAGWSQAEMDASASALACHFGTISGGNDPTFEPDQGFDFGRWLPIAAEAFLGLPDGSDPPGWFENGAGNSLLWSDAFEVSAAAYRTKTADANVHSHWLLPPRSSYRYTGRMRIAAGDTGIGVTFLSDFPNSDRYYRLRRGPFLGGTFHLAPHGTALTSGTTDSGVLPLIGVWYRFHVAVEATAAESTIRANVWQEGSPEPAGWQIDAVDSSGTRLTSGVAGVWAMNGGASWDDLSLTPTCESSAACLGSETCWDGVCVEPTTAVPTPSSSAPSRALLAVLVAMTGITALARLPRPDHGPGSRGR
jgi:LmbE family N-acetylglucosaminyl deacetylase